MALESYTVEIRAADFMKSWASKGCEERVEPRKDPPSAWSPDANSEDDWPEPVSMLSWRFIA
eukprot:5530658-Amphidinium_carterae.2